MPKPTPPTAIAHIAPFTIEADKKARFVEVAEASHRTVTQHLRHLIDQAIAEADREPDPTKATA